MDGHSHVHQLISCLTESKQKMRKQGEKERYESKSAISLTSVNVYKQLIRDENTRVEGNGYFCQRSRDIRLGNSTGYDPPHRSKQVKGRDDRERAGERARERGGESERER